MANFPNRCQHLKVNGTQCGSPALRRNRFCYFHKRFQDERIRLSADRDRRGVATFVLPVLEDANSIQIALMQVMRLLVSQQMDHKTASLLLYALQTASTNLRMTKFDPRRHDVILDPREVADTQLNEHVWHDRDFEEEVSEEEQRLADEAAKKQREAAMMRKIEAEFPIRKPAAPANPSAAVTATGSAVMSPQTPAKKPSAGLNPAKVRAEIAEQVREAFFPGLPKSPLPGKEKVE